MTPRRFYLQLAVLAVCSFAGGFAGMLFSGHRAEAQQQESFFAVSDAKNPKGVNTYVSDGQGGQIFYGENGLMRLQMGTYNGPGERGLPLLALSDNGGHIRMLLRLAGDNESPVLIMKDKKGSDRLVMGLGLSDAKQEPFLSITDSSGHRQNVFGSY